MATYDHLPLKRLEGTLERRRHGFGKLPEREAKAHGAKVRGQIDQAIIDFQALPKVDGVDPSLILKVSLDTPIDEDEWRKADLTILSVNGDKSVVLFANDTALQSFVERVEAYRAGLPAGQKNPSYANLVAAIGSVSILGPGDRIGPSLGAIGINIPDDFQDLETYLLDVELHYPPEKAQTDIFMHRLGKCLEANKGELLSPYNGNHLLLARVRCTGAGVKAVLKLPEVAMLDFPPQPDLAAEDISDIDLKALSPGSSPPKEAIVIGIIDSGVNFGHPLLASSEAAAIALDDAWSPSDTLGHGTSVASIAVFGDIHARAKEQNFDVQFRIASTRVVDDNGRFPDNRALPDLMDEAITRLHRDFGCRIFNISLGNKDAIFADGRVTAWAASLDALASGLDVLIVVAAGNRTDLAKKFSDKIIEAYPHLLLEPHSRLLEPATAANVLTVGAIAHANGLKKEDEDLVGVRPICEGLEPSPFTRCGPGAGHSIKPDLVDFGGNAVWDGPTSNLVNGGQKSSAGIWTFHHKPLERLFRSRSGTSFAAPNVAYKAALLLSRFPEASSNLLRSLLALSANIPDAVLSRQDGLSEKQAITVCGYGMPDAEHAASSDDGRVVLYTEDELPLDHFAVYEVPIPDDFQTKGAKEIVVSLAFDPPARHTRADYLGVRMGWRLIRGASDEEVFDHFRKWEAAEGEPPEFPPSFTCPTDIGARQREGGTLQSATYRGKADISKYGGSYFVAVWCLRRWAPKEFTSQRFALSVQLRHQDVVTLYEKLRQIIKV